MRFRGLQSWKQYVAYTQKNLNNVYVGFYVALNWRRYFSFFLPLVSIRVTWNRGIGSRMDATVNPYDREIAVSL